MEELKILVSCSACTFLLCGLFLWFRRDYGDRSRRYLCYTWVVAGVAFLIRLVISALDQPIFGRVLPPENLSGGLIALLMLYLYPMEAINSSWFVWKLRIKLFFPGMILIVLLLVLRPYCRELTSFADIWLYISEFNVWFRMFVLFFCIVPYTVLLFYIPYNWRKTSVSNQEIIRFSLSIQLIAFLFILFMLTGSALVSILHQVVVIGVAVRTTYYELFIRFELPKEEVSEIQSTSLLNVPEAEPKVINPLIEELYRLMDEEEIWRNPDMNLPELASKLYTNRSYLSKAIQEAGFKNYSDLINQRRIMEFLKLADSGQIASIQDAFFQVGFRSRETALRCFKKYTGILPTDYLRNRTSSSIDI